MRTIYLDSGAPTLCFVAREEVHEPASHMEEGLECQPNGIKKLNQIFTLIVVDVMPERQKVPIRFALTLPDLNPYDFGNQQALENLFRE